MMDAAALAAKGIVNAVLNRHGFVNSDNDNALVYNVGEDDDLLPTQSNGEVRMRRKRSTIEWDLVGVYHNEEDMMVERMKEKVSKRITDHLRVGRKVKYRCNKWKTTRCAFQMYALYALDGSISLYRTGQHNHEKSPIRRSRGPGVGAQLSPVSSFGGVSSSSAPTMVPMQHQYMPIVSSSQYLQHNGVVGGAFGGSQNGVKNESFDMDESGEADSSILTQRFNWQLVGVYPTEQEMAAERIKERVTKRAANNLVMGRKVNYRCSQYRNTGCLFQMYVLYGRDGNISLYKANEHNHIVSTTNEPEDQTSEVPFGNDDASPTMVAQPSTLQSSLSLLVQHALAQGSTDDSLHQPSQGEPASIIGSPPTLSRQRSALSQREAPVAMSSSTNSSVPDSSMFGSQGEEGVSNSQPSYSLSDGQSIAQLLQVSAEMDLTFTFNARRGGEYCFEASSSNGRSTGSSGRMVVLADMGDDVRISVRVGPEEIDVEMWVKADWQQFLWAVRGKCQKALK